MLPEKIKILVVDDEPLAREGICLLLSKDLEIEVVGDCSNGIEASLLIHKFRPDIIFLDIEMPELNGFELLSKCESDRLPIVIFVTAFEQYALKAFEAQALDYLLKPFTDKRFWHVLERAKEHLKNKIAKEQNLSLQKLLESFQKKTTANQKNYLAQILVKLGNRFLSINVEDIVWIEAKDYYSEIYLKDKSYLLREPLNDLETKLDPTKYLRVHRSAIINLSCVKEIETTKVGNALVVLKNGLKLSVSRRRRTAIQIIKNRLS